MAILRVTAPDRKILRVDVGDADPSEYDDLASAAVEDYMGKKGASAEKSADDPIAKQRKLIADLEAQGVDQTVLAAQRAKLVQMTGQNSDGVSAGDIGKAAWDTVKDVGTLTKAGGTGIADLVAGNGLDTSAANIKRVEDDKLPTTTAGNIGKALGAQVTPEQIALMAAFGKVGDMIGPWVGRLMKGWAADAAVNAVGKIKNIAKTLGVTNLDAVGKFLLSPIEIGGKTFQPIVSATSSPQEMLSAANAVREAAGKQLGAVSTAVDGAIKTAVDSAGTAMNDAPVVLDMAALTKNVEALKNEAVGDLPNLGKAVAKQFDDALADLGAFIKKQANGETETMFSDLASIKTKIGNLVYKHGSPLESKAALNDVYHAISEALDQAASKVGGENGAAYAQANAVYHQSMAIVEALTGKVVDAKKWFDAPSFLAAMTAGFATHGPLAAATVPAAYVGMKVGQNYAPQAIAQGLSKGAPLVAKGLAIGARGIPVIGNAIAQALQSPPEE